MSMPQQPHHAKIRCLRGGEGGKRKGREDRQGYFQLGSLAQAHLVQASLDGTHEQNQHSLWNQGSRVKGLGAPWIPLNRQPHPTSCQGSEIQSPSSVLGPPETLGDSGWLAPATECCHIAGCQCPHLFLAWGSGMRIPQRGPYPQANEDADRAIFPMWTSCLPGNLRGE